jgi:hypothetical protein
MRLFVILAIILGFCLPGEAQNIETISLKSKPGLSGGVHLGTQFYAANGIANRRSPFSYNLSGNLRLKWGLVNVPLSFSFRDQNLSYNARFNKFGISPYYKWAKLHIGHRSMRFSNYSLNGKNFFGVGTELTPGKLRFSAFYGNIRNHLAQRDERIVGGTLVPTFNRRAYGAKIGYGTRANHFDIIFLKIKDVENEPISDEPVPGIQLDPAENIVLGTQWQTTFFKRLQFGGTINFSAFTENTALQGIPLQNSSIKFLNNWTTINPSTRLSMAGELNAGLNFPSFGIGLQYRRVEPNYRSLGMTFIQADIEAYTAMTRFSFFKRKLSLNLRGGYERNNLRNLDYLGRQRLIGSARLTLLPAKGWNIGIHYSNFQYESVDGLVEINDTLRQVSVNESMGLNMNYTFRSEHRSFGLFASFQRNVNMDQSPILTIARDIVSINGNLGIRWDWSDLGLTIRPSLIYTQIQIEEMNRTQFGGSARMNKELFNEKLQAALQFRWSGIRESGAQVGHIIFSGLNLRYQLNTSQQIVAMFSYMDRRSSVRTDFNEFRSSLSYGLNF